MTPANQRGRLNVLFLNHATEEQLAAAARLEGDVGQILVNPSMDRLLAAATDDGGWWMVISGAAVVEPQAARRFEQYATLRGPETAAAYSDFFHCPNGLGSQQPVHVGGWSVERARWQSYTGEVAWLRPDAVRAMASQPQLGVHQALVASQQLGSVAHCPMPLYTTPDDRVGDVSEAERAAMLAAAEAPFGLTAGRPPRRMQEWPSVSVVIPTRGGFGEVRGADVRLIDVTLRSVIDTTQGLEPQFVVVVDDDVDTSYLDPWIQELGDRLVVVDYSPPFNFSEKVNAGVEAATGEVVAILNDDIEAIDGPWLDNLVAAAMEPSVGAVGAMLLLEDGTIQHAGHAFSIHGPQLLDVGVARGEGPRRRNACDRDVTGVSAACLVQRREVWEQVRGFDPLFPINFNDVDYCMRIIRLGLRVVQCNSSVLYHFESQTKARGAAGWELERLRWRMVPDGLFSPDELTPADPPEDLSLIPRMRRRWTKARRVMRTEGPSGVVRQWRMRGATGGTQPPSRDAG